MWIEPKGFSEVHTRGNTEAHRLQDPSKWVPFGVGAIEGTVIGRRCPSSSRAIRRPRSARPVYGPGEEPRPREGEPTGVRPRGAALAALAQASSWLPPD